MEDGMDRVFSARVDETVITRIAGLARQLHASKKSVIEKAVAMFAAKVEAEAGSDVFEQTSGTWRRTESPDRTVSRARKVSRESMERCRS
jgi:hypothetical protein